MKTSERRPFQPSGTIQRWPRCITDGARPLGLLIMTALAACGGERPSESESGDTILSLQDVLRIGVDGGDPDREFHQVQAVVPDGAGGVWVADFSPSIRRYDAGGRYVGSVGGRGQGPGEAERYTGLLAGDGWLLAYGSPGVLQRSGLQTVPFSSLAQPDARMACCSRYSEQLTASTSLEGRDFGFPREREGAGWSGAWWKW
jgi:hypothetical protein